MSTAAGRLASGLCAVRDDKETLLIYHSRKILAPLCKPHRHMQREKCMMQATGLRFCGQRFQLVVRSPQLSKNLEAELDIAPISVVIEPNQGK